MIVDIKGGGDGVYANSGSCTAAAMYCEHERQELMKKGLKPETFFHQYSDFVSTGEVIEKIDHNKKHLRKEDAKFFVMTVNPSADEQRKMGESLDERIAAFKSYIRNGVMAEYANNFNRGLTANDIMYYAYVHVDRGDKTGEQMHAHIIVSRRNMDNSISLSPKSNHRTGKGVIAHGFNRELFTQKCEKAFDCMMDYSRPIEESFEYYRATKSRSYLIREQLAVKLVEQELTDVDMDALGKFVKEKLNPKAVTETATPTFESAPKEIPVPDAGVKETVTPVHQKPDSGIMGVMKKVWSFASGIFGMKEAVVSDTSREEQPVAPTDEKSKNETKSQAEIKPVRPVKDTPKDGLYIFKANGKDYYSARLVRGGKAALFAEKLDSEDVGRFFQTKNSNNPEFRKKVVDDITAKYFLLPLAQRVADDFHKKHKNENVTSVHAFRNHLGYCGVRYEVDNDWQPGYKISDRYANEINALPTQSIEFVFNQINNLLIDAFPTVSAGGENNNNRRKRNDDDDDKKKRRMRR